MQPDCRDIKPVYEQITDGIRKMIITHAIPEGEKLPSVRELASKFAINPNAVRKAYQELEEEGYVCDREGERMAASEKQIAELIRKELLQEFDTVVIRLQKHIWACGTKRCREINPDPSSDRCIPAGCRRNFY